MTQGPAPRVLSDEALSGLLGSQRFGTPATMKRSGHWDPGARVVRISTTADRGGAAATALTSPYGVA
ncbi:hypothetical protein A4V12_11585 [Streptomyces noursei]|nr:hypothetical protein A4V12_11585 [Streptomyces noursei]